MRQRLASAVLVLALLAATGGQVVRMRDRVIASRILWDVEGRTMEAMATGRLSKRLFGEHLRLLRRAEALDPAEVGIPVARGGQYLLLGRAEAAAQAYREALSLEARPEGYLNLGRSQLALGETEEALASFVRAVKLSRMLLEEVPGEMRDEVRRRVSEASGGGR